MFLYGTVFSISGAYRYLGKTPSTARSSQGVLANMKLALSEQVHVNGLKGLSPLVNLPGYDLVRGQAVEYMHAVLLGVTRQVASFWFDTSNSDKSYYIGKTIFIAFTHNCCGMESVKMGCYFRNFWLHLGWISLPL